MCDENSLRKNNNATGIISNGHCDNIVSASSLVINCFGYTADDYG